MVEPDGYDLPPTQPEWQRWEQPRMEPRPPPDTSWLTFETIREERRLRGGIVRKPRFVGERGPETYIPDTAGRVMVLGPDWEYETLPSPMRDPERR